MSRSCAIDSLAGIGATPLGEARLLNPPGNGPQARFLAFEHPRSQAWKQWLEEQEVITDVRGDVLRIGIGLYPRSARRGRAARSAG